MPSTSLTATARPEPTSLPVLTQRSPGRIRALLGRRNVQSAGFVRTERWGVEYGAFAQHIPSEAADFSGSSAAIALSTAP
ncbi:hypothetical protein [Streptomyces anulatus]|uniref:hypothetical protein n=1 Tax=Streptomyces anulatus TaxID=1892 RepID=UPI002F91AF97